MEQKHNTERKKENVELRSENTRRFVGEIPPVLVRTGTLIISFIVILFALATLLVKYKGEYLWAIMFHR